jgi:hypothetical protein
MPESRKGAQHARTPGPPQPPPGAAAVNDTEEIVLTLNKATHEVVQIARLDKTGQRRELSQDQAAELAGHESVRNLLQAIDDAYRAGLSEGLAANSDEEDVDDDVLIRLLVGPSAEPDVLELGSRATLLRPILLRRMIRDHIGAVPNTQQQRRTPISDRPRNGSASHT